MNDNSRKIIEFGDFQTPIELTDSVCRKLLDIGIAADTIIEPTCGVGGFVIAAQKYFTAKQILGFEINDEYINTLSQKLEVTKDDRIKIEKADFFSTNWKEKIKDVQGSILVLGNFPWVTNSKQGGIGGDNLPNKNNFQNFRGLDAITGKANFDISEWMLLEALSWFSGRVGSIAMLVKTAVARKIIAHTEKNKIAICRASIYKINAKNSFNASVDACLLLIEINSKRPTCYDYFIFDSLDSEIYIKIGHRAGVTVANLDDYEKYSHLFGESSIKWRSGIKHDLSSIMELTEDNGRLLNGLGEKVEIESDLLFPLMKGSDIGSGKEWRKKFVIVTQASVGQDTAFIKEKLPKTWNYLLAHSDRLDSRGSVIYKKNPRFSIFGVGNYSFKPWKIAICGLYKSLNFRLIGDVNGKPFMFDDTVYFISFDTREKAVLALDYLNRSEVKAYLSSLIFWDDKRPIKTTILNTLSWDGIDYSQHSYKFISCG